MSRRLRLLLVEDNPGDVALIREMLPRSGPEGFDLETVPRLAAAVLRLDQEGVDAVILDLGLPDSRGLATVQAVVGRYPHVPVVVLTERADDADAMAAVKAGAQDYQIKGELSSPVLVRAIRYAMERKQAEEALRFAARKWRETFDAITDAVFLMDARGRILQCNRAFAEFYKKPYSELIGRACSRILHGDKGPGALCPRLRAKESRSRERMILVKEGREFELILDPVFSESGEFEGAVHTMRDVTEARTAARKQQLSAVILQILNRSGGIQDMIRDIIRSVCEALDIEAGAIRLRDEDDYPYAVADGFSMSFLRKEISLTQRAGSGEVVRDGAGRPELLCICGAVIRGGGDARLKSFTPGGSFWTNSAPDLLAAGRVGDLGLVPKAPCLLEGFESQAFIPIRSGAEVLGLLQLSDHRRGRFGADLVKYLEGLAGSIGVAVRRLKDVETVGVSEDRFRGLFEHIRSGVAVYEPLPDLSDFIIRDFNEAAEKIEKVRKQDILGKKVTEVFPGVGAFGLLDVMRRVWKTGWAEPFPAAFYKDERISGWRENTIYKLPNGEIVAVYDDVTERKSAEAELKFRNLILTTQQEASIDGILVVDENARILSWNRRFVEMFGLPADLVAAGDDEPVLAFNTALMADPPAFLERVRYLYDHPRETSWDELALADGRVFERYSAPMVGEGDRYFGRVWYFRDMTERKRAQEDRDRLQAQLLQAQKLEAVGTLAGGVAHEINNPIMGILNYAELLGGHLPADSPGRTYIEEIKAEGARVASIVKNLLRFSRQEKAESRSPARVVDIVDVTLSLIRTVLRHDQIALETDLPGDLPRVLCRSQQIQQVLMNLATNARDALNQKYPGFDERKKIRVSAREIGEGGGRRVRLTVEDLGPGVPPEIQEKLFDPFFTTKPKDKGTGLGLTISHGIVRDHGGKLWLESEPGEWTRFHVDLPAERLGEGDRDGPGGARKKPRESPEARPRKTAAAPAKRSGAGRKP